MSENLIQINGSGLFSKGEVSISILKGKANSGITFEVNGSEISADLKNVSNANRNTVLSNGKESICLVEHFLATCSIFSVDDIRVITNCNELVFEDGSAMHWQNLFEENNFSGKIERKYQLSKAIFLKNNDKSIAALPSTVFKVSYLLDYDNSVIGKLFATWTKRDAKEKLTKARTFAKKEENKFFSAQDKLLSFDENGFDKPLNDPLEPAYHKILDIIGDLRLIGINPLEINMHVIGIKSGHAMNIEIAREIKGVIAKSASNKATSIV